MALDPIKNFAIATVSTGYNDSATTVVLSSGEGAKFPDPSTDGAFNVVWWDSTNYSNPADDPDKEIVRVTARSTDTLTVTRGQEGTSGTTKNTAGATYLIAQTITGKIVEDIEEVSINEQTGTSYTLVLADKSKLVDCANASAITLTVPPNSSVAFPIGSKIAVRQSDDGAITLTPGSGVTLQSQDSALATNGQYAMCVLIKVDTDTWAVEGNVVA